MGKTFDEWFEEDKESIKWVLNYTGHEGSLKLLMKICWDASRQNMTYKDI